MKKILHVSISSERGGGPEHIYQLISGLTNNSFESYVACPSNGPYYEKFKLLTSNRVTTIPFRKFTVFALYRLYKFIKDNNIKILHGHGKGAGLYCRIISMIHEVYVVHTPHGINQSTVGLSSKLYNRFEKLFGFLITAIIYVSKTEFNYAQEHKMWMNVDSRIIFNGTKLIPSDVAEFWRKSLRKEMSWNAHKVIIMATRFDYQKNTLEFCKIAKELPEFTFILLGDGEEKTQCEEYCQDNAIGNVSFIGSVPNPLHYFAASDLYLSTARWEGLSMAILEAMSVGVPIVASKVIGNSDLVRHGNMGFLYDLGNINQAKSYILKALDTKVYSSLASNAKDTHERTFSSKLMCTQTEKLYLDIVNNNGN